MKIPNSKDNFDTYRSIRYYLNDGNILRNVNGAGHNIVAYGIKDLQFISDPGSDLITITIVGESGFSVSTKAFVRVDKSFLFQQ